MGNLGMRKKYLMSAHHREIQAIADNDYARWRHCFVAAFLVATLGVAADAAHGALNEAHTLAIAESRSEGFGQSVGVSDGTAIVGAWKDDAAAGSAYLFDVATGNFLYQLTASDAAADDRLGANVAISGNTAIAGAHFDNGDRGSAYLFDVATGNELDKLTASDAAPGDVFGAAVAISGDVAIVGARLNDAAHAGAGSAYLFDADPMSPTFGDEFFKLIASDAAAGDNFGRSVGVSGGVAIVGADGNDDAGVNSDSGSAYLFDVDPMSPTFGDELKKLTASDEAENAVFGRSVSISDGVAIVGAPGSGGGTYLFDADPMSLTFGDELLKLTDSGSFNGSAVISDGTAIVFTEFPSGVYLFDADPMSPTFGDELFELVASDAAEIGSFGRAVGISGGAAIVGARTADATAGLAYLFSITPGDNDHDFDVDGFDFIKWQRGESPNPLSQSDLDDWEANYGTAPTPTQPGDFDGNGIVDGHDLLKWQLDTRVGSLAEWEANYGMGASLSASAAVPEHTTATLALAALCSVIGRRRIAAR